VKLTRGARERSCWPGSRAYRMPSANYDKVDGVAPASATMRRRR